MGIWRRRGLTRSLTSRPLPPAVVRIRRRPWRSRIARERRCATRSRHETPHAYSRRPKWLGAPLRTDLGVKQWTERFRPMSCSPKPSGDPRQLRARLFVALQGGEVDVDRHVVANRVGPGVNAKFGELDGGAGLGYALHTVRLLPAVEVHDL